jgi:hypothetical protein
LIKANSGGIKDDTSGFLSKRARAEFPVFLKVLRALPKDLGYKPHDRVVDTGRSEWEDIKPPSLDEMIGMYEKWSTELLDKVSALDDASEQRNAQFLYQGRVVMEKPMMEFLWTSCSTRSIIEGS